MSTCGSPVYHRWITTHVNYCLVLYGTLACMPGDKAHTDLIVSLTGRWSLSFGSIVFCPTLCSISLTLCHIVQRRFSLPIFIMRAYALYEHPGFDLSPKEAASSRLTILKVAGAFTLVAASSVIAYQILTTGRVLPPTWVSPTEFFMDDFPSFDHDW